MAEILKSKDAVASAPTKGLTKLLALIYTEDDKQFNFAVDGDCFHKDHLLRQVLQRDFLPKLNNVRELRYALMQLTAHVTSLKSYRQSIPEIFQEVLDRPTEDSFRAPYILGWQSPLREVFHFLCQDNEQEMQLFPVFELETNNLLMGRHPRPMNADSQSVKDIGRVVITKQTPHELLDKLDHGQVDPRTMIIANAAMRAYGYVFGRTISGDS